MTGVVSKLENKISYEPWYIKPIPRDTGHRVQPTRFRRKPRLHTMA